MINISHPSEGKILLYLCNESGMTKQMIAKKLEIHPNHLLQVFFDVNQKSFWSASSITERSNCFRYTSVVLMSECPSASEMTCVLTPRSFRAVA